MFFLACLILAVALISSGKTVSRDPENSAGIIKIGLLIQDSSYISAVQGAELAIREANKKEGPGGHHFLLVVRSLAGPWGTGSKEAVNLIFEEKVWAILGSHNGRNAHLVEQVATKSQVVFLSAWPGDPTLSQAFVPWFFNCVPNDNQQAVSFTDEIFNKRKFDKIAVVSDNVYDSNLATESFLKTVKKSGRPDPVQFNYDSSKMKVNDLSDDLKKSGADCIVLFCSPQTSMKITGQIRQKKMNLPLYGSLTLMNEDELSPRELMESDNILSIPSGGWSGPEYMAFRQKFQQTFNKIPGMVASYSYDGMRVLIEAIRIAGSNDREMIQKSLENIHLNGVTGPIQFDEKGNRLGKFEIMKTKNGVPIAFKNEIPRLRPE
jgi:branched-chain amino acid transport system substrate-binding protein